MANIQSAENLLDALIEQQYLSDLEIDICRRRLENLGDAHDEFDTEPLCEAIFNGVNSEAMIVVREYEHPKH